MTIEVELFDGTILEFPDGTSPTVIDNVARQETQARNTGGVPSAEQGTAALPQDTSEVDKSWLTGDGYQPKQNWRDAALDYGASAARGVRRGVASVLGAPVDLINASPMALNILPGEQGFKPISETPVGGADTFDQLMRLGGAVPDYQPQTTGGRVTNRIGEEVGATVVPLAAAGAAATRLGVEGARQLNPVARHFVEPMAVNPGKVASREMQYAAAAGSGAQAANEIFTPDGEGTWWSDLLGSLGGMTALGTAKAVGGFARNAYGAATGRTGAFDDVAGRAVADRIIDNSSDLQAQYLAGGKGAVNAGGLADALARPSPAEQAIPGFRANIADRVQDPGISTLAYNTDTALPGAANARRTANAAAVDQRMQEIAPDANPAGLREALATGAERRISEAADARSTAQRGFEDASAAATPQMANPVERGSAIRGALQGRHDSELERIAQMYGELDPNIPVDMNELRRRVDAVTEGLPLNDRARFSPSETQTVQQLAPSVDPIDTGILDASGRPIVRGPDPAPQPLSEAMAVRSGLASDLRAPSATSQQKRVTGQYLDEVDDFIRSALPEDQVAQMDAAKAARLDVGRRFEDRGAVPEILNKTGRDQYRAPDEAVPGRVTRGETDYRAVMAESGQDPAARRAVADQILADAQSAKATRSPEALAKFMQDRNFALADFPEVRSALEQAGTSAQTLQQAERAAAQAQKLYEPGGRSPAGQYLRYDDTNTRKAIGTAWKSDQPERAMRELLDVAGNTPEVRASARAALWEEVGGAGKLDAATMTSADGVQRWSGRKLKQTFDDPRFSKAADVLWEDNPEHLQDIRNVVDALAKADGSVNAKAPAASGTAQSLSGQYDPALSTSSIASRVRSVHRGQLSPTIAVVDVLSTALRNRSARVQDRAINELMARAINDPDLASSLLRKFNPADEAAENRAFLSAYGVRLPTVANIISGIDDNEDETFNRYGVE